jgi:hypothetical protein
MIFQNRKDCDLWCRIGNELWLKLDHQASRFGEKLRASADPRLHQLDDVLCKLGVEFREKLNSEMDRIDKESSPRQ